MSNQCEHGQLARVCERCEDKAEIERLRLTLTMVRPYVYGLDNIKSIDAALSRAQAEQPSMQQVSALLGEKP